MQAEEGSQNSSRVKRLEPSEDVVGQQLDEEVVLIHLKTNRIFELNHTGGRFWNLLQSENERERIEQRLHEEYDVSQGDLAAEVDSLISTLASEGLVRILERD